MALRLVEVILPADRAADLNDTLATVAPAGPWQETLGGGQILVRLLLEAETTGPVVDALDERFGRSPNFKLLILPIEAALPRMEEATPTSAPQPPESVPALPKGVIREELYNDICDMTGLTRTFLVTVVLSVIVAAVGILRDNVAIIIGAMVIAPLLGPNMALAFGATLGDSRLLVRSLATNAVGFAVTVAMSVAAGAVFAVDPSAPEIASRTSVGFADVLLPLAAGGAGALALTAPLPTGLVGVMVAVALMPPTVVMGLLAGAGYWRLSAGAALLVAATVICINLAGVVTFLAQGIRPRVWWEAKRARRSARIALALWLVLLVILSLLIFLAHEV